MSFTKLKIEEASFQPIGPKGKLKLFIRIKDRNEPERVRDTGQVPYKKLKKTFRKGKKVSAMTSTTGAVLAYKVGKAILLQTL